MPFTSHQINRILDEPLSHEVQRGLDIYLAFLQNYAVYGKKMIQIGHDIESAAMRLSQAATDPEFDYSTGLRKAHLIKQQAEFFATVAEMMNDWIAGVHAVH